MPTRLSVLGVRIPEKAIQGRRVMPVALGIVVGLTVLEWYQKLDFSLGIFYTLPVVVAATALNRWQIIAFSVFCACVRGLFTPAASSLEFFLKFVMASIAYCATGLLIVEMNANRRRALEHYARLKLEQDLRRRAEEQLRLLAESSPAAILTLNGETEVQAANHAAHEMLHYPADTLVGRKLDIHFPFFSDALKLAQKDRAVRTSLTGWARRRDNQVFPVQAWFSVYGQEGSTYLAAIVVDMSEEVRDRERENFQHLLDYNRLLAGAVSHEIRNLCSAIGVVCTNLRERGQLRGDADFDALLHLVEGLSRLASFELRHKSENQVPRADLRSVLDQLRIVVEPDWEEIDGEVVFHIPAGVPLVAGDAHGLMQIFLNLCQNSLRAVQESDKRRLTVAVKATPGAAVVSFSDSGPGVARPDILFHPFRAGADGSGLGLYISRELVRTFGGELQHVPTPSGCEFRVVIPAVTAAAGTAARALA